MSEQRTVTIPLEEYIVMKENSETLHKALNEREVVYLGNSMGEWHRYFISSENETINAIKLELNNGKKNQQRVYGELEELRKKHKNTICELQNRYSNLSITFDEYTEASLWTRIMRVFNKQY